MFNSDINVTTFKRGNRRFFLMRYQDPVTGESVTRSTKTTKRREADRIAAKWEKELREGSYHKPTNISWEEFRERYEAEKLASLSTHTDETAQTAFNHLEKLINPNRLSSLTPLVLSRFQSKLRDTGIKETSIATHLRHLRAALNWAVEMGILPVAPAVAMPKRAKGRRLMRGRPISLEEFERMLSVTEEVRPDDAAPWRYYLEGLWLSGLRLEESLLLTWDDEGLLSVDLTGRRPRLRIWAEGEKGHEDRILPVVPDFAEFLLQTPIKDRREFVFPIQGLNTGTQMTAKRVSRVISAIGKRAGIIVNRAENKFATAHDLRRSFGTRWASRVKPATLQLLMRHKSIETTMRFYVAQDTDEVADQLWAEFGPGHSDSSDASTSLDARI